MPTLTIYVTDETLARMESAALRLDRSVDDLAESAVEEAALKDHLDQAPRYTLEPKFQVAFGDAKVVGLYPEPTPFVRGLACANCGGPTIAEFCSIGCVAAADLKSSSGA